LARFAIDKNAGIDLTASAIHPPKQTATRVKSRPTIIDTPSQTND